MTRAGQPTQGRTTRGRPRDEAADAAILDAALQILAERGYDGLTMEGVAERAGVAKTTVYRRWPTRTALVAALAEAFTAPVRPPSTGTLKGDLQALLLDVTKALKAPHARRVIPRALADARDHAELDATLRPFWAARRQLTIDILRRGIERGDLNADIDLEIAADALYGPIYYRYLVTGAPLSERVVIAIVDRAIDGMRAFR